MSSTKPLGIAFVGCGYVADFYRHCLTFHADRLRLVGSYDRDSERLAAFGRTWGDRTFRSLDELLSDPAVELVVNLTPPEQHAAVSLQAIAARRHVYSEKPLGMTLSEAVALRDAAAAAKIRLAAAPSNMLGEAAQTLIKAVAERQVGDIRLVYAELDDGMVHQADYRNWISRSGRPWPAEGEFEVGCTFEHAGYIITLLVAMFGPVRRVTAFSALLAPEKGVGGAAPHLAPDFSTGCLEFDGGVVARLTNSIVAPYDHRLRLVGDEGILDLDEPWDFASPIRLRRTATTRLQRVLERRFHRRGRRLRHARAVPFRGGRGRPTMDFMRGVRELADAIAEDRPSRMGPDLAVHVTEVTEMLQHPERFAMPARVTSTAPRIERMPWAV